MSKSKKIFMITSFLISGAGGLLHECMNNPISAICYSVKYSPYACTKDSNGFLQCIDKGDIGVICKPVA